jgi:hypothetical protein
MEGPIGYNATTLTNDINESKPDILWHSKIDPATNNIIESHYFVGKGIVDNTFLINDPFFNRLRLDDPAYGNTASQMIRYKEVHSDFSALIVPVVAPGQVLITDPNGKRLGYDPVTASVVHEIPNSNYYFQQPITNPTDQNNPPPPNSGNYWANIGTPQAGAYTVQVFPSGQQEYSFGMYSYDKDSHLTLNSYFGETVIGVTPTYSFFYNPVPSTSSDPVTIRRKVQIKVIPQKIYPKAGVLAVAILGEADFSVKDIDIKSVRLGNGEARP